MQCAANVGPLSVAVNAGSTGWQSYTSGILSTNCGTAVDHAVVLVGYNTSGTTPYWIVRNSWGASWGVSGYVNVKMDTSSTGPILGVCGINMYVSYPYLFWAPSIYPYSFNSE